MNCVYVRFPPSKQQSFFWKAYLNSCLIGLDQLYTGRAGKRLLIKYYLEVYNGYHAAYLVAKWPGLEKVPSSIPSGTCFCFCFCFSLLFFFPFSLTFSLKFFKFINFLAYCFISLSTSCRSLAKSFTRSCDSRISSWYYGQQLTL